MLRRERKRAKMRIFSPILHNDTTSNSCIANRRLGGESTHRIVYFIHRSICGAANIQILNWSERCGDSTSPQFDSAKRAPSTKISIDLEFINPIWLGCLGCLDRLALDFSLREDLHYEVERAVAKHPTSLFIRLPLSIHYRK